MNRQCSSCGGFCRRSGCERENVPEKREWVGLTEAERVDIIDIEIPEPNTDHWALAQSIEAKLKEKNNG